MTQYSYEQLAALMRTTPPTIKRYPLLEYTPPPPPPRDLVNPITFPYDTRVLARSLRPNPPTHLLYAKACSRPHNPIENPQLLVLCDSHPYDSKVFFGQKVQIQITDIVHGSMTYDPTVPTVKGWIVGVTKATHNSSTYLVAGILNANVYLATLQVPMHRNEGNFPHTAYVDQEGDISSNAFLKIDDIPAYLNLTDPTTDWEPSNNQEVGRLLKKVREIRAGIVGPLHERQPARQPEYAPATRAARGETTLTTIM